MILARRENSALARFDLDIEVELSSDHLEGSHGRFRFADRRAHVDSRSP